MLVFFVKFKVLGVSLSSCVTSQPKQCKHVKAASRGRKHLRNSPRLHSRCTSDSDFLVAHKSHKKIHSSAGSGGRRRAAGDSDLQIGLMNPSFASDRLPHLLSNGAHVCLRGFSVAGQHALLRLLRPGLPHGVLRPSPHADAKR